MSRLYHSNLFSWFVDFFLRNQAKRQFMCFTYTCMLIQGTRVLFLNCSQQPRLLAAWVWYLVTIWKGYYWYIFWVFFNIYGLKVSIGHKIIHLLKCFLICCKLKQNSCWHLIKNEILTRDLPTVITLVDTWIWKLESL